MGINETFIPLAVPDIRGNEWKYVKECLDTNWISSAGSYVNKFEGELAKFTHVDHCVAVVNGTAALHICLLLAGVQANDEVIVPTCTFIAPINAVTYVNAIPVFMDADAFYNMDVKKTVEFFETQTTMKNGVCVNKNSNRVIRAVIPVHVFGNAVDLTNLIKVCKEKNVKVIEDSTESLGTSYKSGPFAGKHTGSVGDYGVLSFNGNKIITTGGGGAVLLNDAEDARKAKHLTTQAKTDEVRYHHDMVGYNYRLTNIQAAIGVAQVEQLDRILEHRRWLISTYKKGLADIPGLHIQTGPEYADNNNWMIALQISPAYGRNREETMSYLSEHKIQTRPLWMLNHLQVPFKHCEAYKVENAMTLLETTLNIPCSPNLTEADVQRVIDTLKKGAR